MRRSEVRTDLPHWRAGSGYQTGSAIPSLDHEMTLPAFSLTPRIQARSKLGELQATKGNRVKLWARGGSNGSVKTWLSTGYLGHQSRLPQVTSSLSMTLE